MKIQTAKEEHHSTTILLAQIIKWAAGGLAVLNAIAIGIEVYDPGFYGARLSAKVNAANTMAMALGVPGAMAIRRGRLNAGGIQDKTRAKTVLDVIIPDSEEHLHQLDYMDALQKRTGMTAEQIERELENARDLDKEIAIRVRDATRQAVEERDSHYKELNQAKLQLLEKDAELVRLAEERDKARIGATLLKDPEAIKSALGQETDEERWQRLASQTMEVT